MTLARTRRNRRDSRALDADVAVVAAYGLILPQADPRRAQAGLPQRPRLAAAALARRGADPARDPGRRRGDRRHHHADGGGPRHRADAARSATADRSRQDCRASDGRTGETRRASADRGGSASRRFAPSRSPTTASPMPPRSTRPRRGSTGDGRPSEVERQVRAFDPAPGAWFEHEGERIKVLAAEVARTRRAPGEGARRSPDHRLRRRVVRSARGPARRPRAMTADELLRGFPIPEGTILPVTRWRLTIEYDGGPFMGWQRQDHGPSVQQALEAGARAHDRRAGARPRRRAHRCRRPRAGDGAHVDIAKPLTAHRLREGLNALVRPAAGPVLDGRAGRRRLARALLLHRPALSLPHPQPPRAAGARRGRAWHVAAAARRRGDAEGAAHARRHATTSPPSARPIASRTARSRRSTA